MVAFGLPFMGFFGVFAARAAAATGGGGLSSSSADGGSARLAESMAAERIAPGYGRAEQILGRPQKQKNLIFLSFPFSHAPAFSFFSCVFLFSSGSVDIVGLVCRSACRFALPGWGPAVAMDVECGLAVAVSGVVRWIEFGARCRTAGSLRPRPWEMEMGTVEKTLAIGKILMT